MKPGSVLVDIAVDQGGCFEDTHPTTHHTPTYKVHNAIFYCVANMPGAVPHTSTYALTNVTLRYGVALANLGVKAAFERDAALAAGLNIAAGQVAHRSVSQAHGLELAEDWRQLAAPIPPRSRRPQCPHHQPGLLTDRLFEMLRATGVRLYAEIDEPIDSPGITAERTNDR